ncbi:MAG: hypothetical protein IPK63_16490 [Candidatus Competibacteraceae bacterium]|nr:hypothetical protein [Candidatus Competibacteraceae bacterium]
MIAQPQALVYYRGTCGAVAWLVPRGYSGRKLRDYLFDLLDAPNLAERLPSTQDRTGVVEPVHAR